MATGLIVLAFVVYYIFAGAQSLEKRQGRTQEGSALLPATAEEPRLKTKVVAAEEEEIDLSSVDGCVRQLKKRLKTYDAGGDHHDDLDCFAGFHRSGPPISELQARRQRAYDEGMRESMECAMHLVPAVNRQSSESIGFAENESHLLVVLGLVQSAIKKSLFCVDMAQELMKDRDGGNATQGMDGPGSRVLSLLSGQSKASFLVLGSVARGEASAFSDLDFGIILDHKEGAEAQRERNDVVTFFSDLKASASEKEVDRNERHFCYKADIGKFLSPVSTYFVGSLSDMTDIHNQLNPYVEEGLQNLVEMVRRAKPQQLETLAEEKHMGVLTRRTVTILTNMYLAAPWSWEGGAQAVAYCEYLCEHWMELETKVTVGNEIVSIPHRHFIILHQHIQMLEMHRKIVRDLREVGTFSPKFLNVLVRAALYAKFWGNANGEMCDIVPRDVEGKSVLDLISILRKHSKIDNAQAKAFSDIWEYAQSIGFINSMVAWEACAHGTERELPIQGYTQDSGSPFVKVEAQSLKVKHEKILAKLLEMSKESFIGDAKSFCADVKDRGINCRAVIVSMQDHLQSRFNLDFVLSEIVTTL